MTARFSPHFPEYVKIHLVDTDEDIIKISPTAKGQCEGCRGLCVYYYHDSYHKADIFFKRKWLSYHIIVHEVTHATLDWAKDVAMPLTNFKTEKETFDYFHELVACANESLSRTIIKKLQKLL